MDQSKSKSVITPRTPAPGDKKDDDGGLKQTAEPSIAAVLEYVKKIAAAQQTLAADSAQQTNMMAAMTQRIDFIEKAIDDGGGYDVMSQSHQTGLQTPSQKISERLNFMQSQSQNTGSGGSGGGSGGSGGGDRSTSTTTPAEANNYQTEKLVIVNALPFTAILEDLHIKNIIKLEDDRDDYNKANGKTVPMHIALSKSVKDRLINDHEYGLTTMKEFDKKSDTDIKAMLLLSAMPKSMTTYVKYFKSGGKFPALPPDYFPTLSNLHKLYSSILQFSRVALDVHDILTNANEKFKPQLWQREKGLGGSNMREECLISLYLEGFPGKLGFLLHKILINHVPKCELTTFAQYTTKFVQNLGGLYQLCEQLAPLASTLADYRASLPTPKKHHLALLEDELEPYEYDHASSVDLLNSELCYISQQPSAGGKVKASGGCYLKMIGRPCPYYDTPTGCKYSHEPAVLKASREEWVKSVMKVEYLPEPKNTRKQVTIAERDRHVKHTDYHHIAPHSSTTAAPPREVDSDDEH